MSGKHLYELKKDPAYMRIGERLNTLAKEHSLDNAELVRIIGCGATMKRVEDWRGERTRPTADIYPRVDHVLKTYPNHTPTPEIPSKSVLQRTHAGYNTDSLRERINAYCRIRDIPVTQLADELEIPRSAMGHYSRGHTLPPPAIYLLKLEPELKKILQGEAVKETQGAIPAAIPGTLEAALVDLGELRKKIDGIAAILIPAARATVSVDHVYDRTGVEPVLLADTAAELFYALYRILEMGKRDPAFREQFSSMVPNEDLNWLEQNLEAMWKEGLAYLISAQKLPRGPRRGR